MLIKVAAAMLAREAAGWEEEEGSWESGREAERVEWRVYQADQ